MRIATDPAHTLTVLSEFRLIGEIVALSGAKNWDAAKFEWTLAEIILAEEPETCLCGHWPIIEVCVIRNRLNGNRARVGNVCVKTFLGLPSDKIFGAIGRVAKDDTRALNTEAIEFAYQRSWINDWQYGFYMDTWRKRVLTERQLATQRNINRLILRNTTG